MELRCPDPACNPYLTFAVLLHAGLEGIEKGYELPEPMEKNLYHLTPDERRRLGIEQLPETLGEAIELTAESELVPARARRARLQPLRRDQALRSGRTTACRSPRGSSTATCRSCDAARQRGSSAGVVDRRAGRRSARRRRPPRGRRPPRPSMSGTPSADRRRRTTCGPERRAHHRARAAVDRRRPARPRAPGRGGRRSPAAGGRTPAGSAARPRAAAGAARRAPARS